MVQDCVLANVRSFNSELDRVIPGSEKGQFLSLNPKLWQVWGLEKRPGRTRQTLVRQIQKKASSFLQTQNPGRFGERTRSNLGSACSRFEVRRKDLAEPWFGRFGEGPVPFSKLQTLAGSEFGERTGPNPNPSFFSEHRTCQTEVRPDPFSELQTGTPNSG